MDMKEVNDNINDWNEEYDDNDYDLHQCNDLNFDLNISDEGY